jgi:hypothetical protein
MRYLVLGILTLTACGGDTFKSTKQRALDSAEAAAAAPTDTASAQVGPRYYIDSVVTWPRLQEIVRHDPDGILAVQQTHTLDVSVAMRNGMRFKAKEPKVDAIIALLREVDPAGRILISNE